MSTNISKIASAGLKDVVQVTDFARRYRGPKDEEQRLLKLFSVFAAKPDLLINARRDPSFR